VRATRFCCAPYSEIHLRHWNDGYFPTRPHIKVNCFAAQQSSPVVLRKKISLAKFSFLISLCARAEFVRLARRAKMAWKTPKIVEVPVGMEINMYACAARK